MIHQRGFTLIEFIIVIVILAVLSVITLPIIQAGFNGYFVQRDLVDANWQGRLALSRMARDIRNIPSVGNISLASGSQFTFQDNTNTTVDYTLSGTTLQRNAIALANGIGSVTFDYYNSSGAVASGIAAIRYVSITLNITRNNTNTTLQTVVNLRDVTS